MQKHRFYIYIEFVDTTSNEKESMRKVNAKISVVKNDPVHCYATIFHRSIRLEF